MQWNMSEWINMLLAQFVVVTINRCQKCENIRVIKLNSNKEADFSSIVDSDGELDMNSTSQKKHWCQNANALSLCIYTSHVRFYFFALPYSP
jgi:hypothetical protein